MSITILGVEVTPTMQAALVRPCVVTALSQGWVTQRTMNRLCDAGLWRRYKDAYQETKRGSQVTRELKLRTDPRAMAAHLADIGETLFARARQESTGPNGNPFAYRKALREFIERCRLDA